jgi:hypothetical protein
MILAKKKEILTGVNSGPFFLLSQNQVHLDHEENTYVRLQMSVK